MSGFYGQFLDTVGIEFEGNGIDRELLSGHLMETMSQYYSNSKRLFNITRDASVESVVGFYRVARNRSIALNNHTKSLQYLSNPCTGTRQMGYEIPTNPMEISELEKIVYPLVFNLVQLGDFVSERAATHFHVGFVNNLRLLKNFLRVALMLDPLLYRLGGMGGTFRGYSNLAAYARPLMNSSCVRIVESRRGRVPEGRPDGNLRSIFDSPIPMRISSDDDDEEEMDGNEDLSEEEFEAIREAQSLRDSRREFSSPEVGQTPNPHLFGDFVQTINPLSALESSNVEQFWAAFGLFYDGRNLTKYHPARYSGTNIFALASHGTLEFRHFNQCLNPQLIMAVAKFLRATVEMSTTLNKTEILQFEPIDCNEEISVSDSAQILEILSRIWREKEIEQIPSDNEMELIFETIERSRFEPIPQIPVMTHSRDSSISRELAEIGKLKSFDKVLKPQQVDIHTIRYQSLFNGR